MARAYMVHFRSEDHEVLSRFGRRHAAYHFQSGRGSLIAQNGKDMWTVQSVLAPDTDESKLDPAAWLRYFVGEDFDFEILVANPWSAHQVVADSYRSGRVLLAGDAVHQVIPTGGYGMNTGIGDAVALGWQLASVINGWAGASMLDAYEIERRQIALQNREAAQRHAEVRFAITMKFIEVEEAGDLDAPEAATRRAELGKVIADLGNAENESWGIEHGYRYGCSPVICYEPGEAPAFDPLYCMPTTTPGARLPSFALEDGVLLYDELGPEFTLLLVGEATDGAFFGRCRSGGTTSQDGAPAGD
ncbi:FAD-dependent monooxygenase [Novosphingobium colocasiae]